MSQFLWGFTSTLGFPLGFHFVFTVCFGISARFKCFLMACSWAQEWLSACWALLKEAGAYTATRRLKKHSGLGSASVKRKKSVIVVRAANVLLFVLQEVKD